MNPKVINSMNARLARIEALLENSDLFKQEQGATYGGLQYQGSTYNIAQATPPDTQQQLQQNYGFGPTDMAIFELQQRIAELELLVAGGSNDTNQSGALDADQSVGDDGESGTGTVMPTPEDLGLGTMAEQDADAVDITGGDISGVTMVGGIINGSSIIGASIATSTAALDSLTVDGDITLDNDGLTSTDALFTIDAVSLIIDGGSVISLRANQIGILANTTDLLGFFGSGGSAKPVVSGSRGGNAALQSLLTALSGFGLITDSTTA